MFQRLLPRDQAGSGVGLAVCREIVELHGGKIWASSEPGKGATFQISLPAAAELSSPSRS
jgi:signal transduction histidine kinase